MNCTSLANQFICDVPVYEPGRPIEEVARELHLKPADIIKLASNENALGPSPKAVAAMRRALKSAHLYPDGGRFISGRRWRPASAEASAGKRNSASGWRISSSAAIQTSMSNWLRWAIALTVLAPAVVLATEPLVIYDDRTTWTMGKTGAGRVDLEQCEVVKSGTQAIALRESNLILTAPQPVSCSGYDRIEFWAHGGEWGTGAKRYDVFVDGNWATFGRQQRFLHIASGKWEKYSVPLSSLGYPTSISQLTFKPDGWGASIYLDDIRLASGPHETYWPMPRYPEMFIDGGFEDGANGQYTAGCKSRIVTNPVHEGKYALRVYDRSPTKAWSGPNFEISRYLMMGGPGTYEIEMWYRAAAGAMIAKPGIEIIYYDPTDNKHGKEEIPGQISKKEVGTEWTQIKYRIRTRFGRAMYVFKVNPVADANTSEYFIDSLSMKKLSDADEPAETPRTIDRLIKHVPTRGQLVANTTARWDVAIIGKKGSGLGEFCFPTGLTVDAAGNLWVADTDNHRLQRLDSAGRWSSVGNGELSYPRSVAVDGNGTVFVADSDNFRVLNLRNGQWSVVAQSDGKNVKAWTAKPKTMSDVRPVKFGSIACDSDGLLVLDPWFGMLCRQKPGNAWEIISNYEMSTRHKSILAEGVSTGRFDLPVGVSVDSVGNIYVADTGNHRIQKRTAGGKWSVLAGVSPDSMKCVVPEWVGSGTQPGQFNLPKAVTADVAGNVYVADSGNHRIQIYEAATGEWLVLGRQGGALGEFDHPYGIAVDRKGRIFVTDTRNHRIVCLTSKQQSR